MSDAPLHLAGYRGPYVPSNTPRRDFDAELAAELVAECPLEKRHGRPKGSGAKVELRIEALALVASGVAQRDVAARVGVAHGTVVRWVAEERKK